MKRRLVYTSAGILFGAAFALVILFGFPPDSDPEENSPISSPALELEGEEAVQPTEEVDTDQQFPQVGDQAFDFELTDPGGSAIELSDLRGSAVLINFWATWCEPCRLEMPLFQDRYERLKDQGFTVLAVNADEPISTVEEFQKELGLTFPILLDVDGQIQRQFRIRGFPTSILIDQDGIIQVVHIGVIHEDQLDEYLRLVELVE
jgi:peroxiredoxin